MSETPLVERLEFIANNVSDVLPEEIEEVCDLAVTELSQAQARCAEVEKDAARYRWLRGKVELGYDDAWSAALKLVLPVFHEKSIGTFVNGSICGHLDAAIDDALKEPR